MCCSARQRCGEAPSACDMESVIMTASTATCTAAACQMCRLFTLTVSGPIVGAAARLAAVAVSQTPEAVAPAEYIFFVRTHRRSVRVRAHGCCSCIMVPWWRPQGAQCLWCHLRKFPAIAKLSIHASNGSRNVHRSSISVVVPEPDTQPR